MTWLLDVLGPDTPAFALLHRPDTGAGMVDLLTGDLLTVPRLAHLPVPVGRPAGGPSADLLALVPYRQVAERGFAGVDDGTPLQALRVRHHRLLPVTEVLAAVPPAAPTLRGAGFDLSDHQYASLVSNIISREIGAGEGANFVIKRSLLATIDGYARQPLRQALAVFGRLLAAESGAHWTFLVHTGTRTLIGASPERHVTLTRGVATMNPISGTLRYPDGPPDVAAVQRFLADGKEVDELYMVLDEELKMMGRICREGGRVVGPRIRPMARLAHTEYFIEGQTDLDVRQILHETMFAPTVTGSPLESACRVIARYEPRGRGYYAGVLALIGRDGTGRQLLDSAVVIRTADIDQDGRMRIDVGATLVRHSDPLSEAAETRAKAAALLAAFGTDPAAAPPASATPTPTAPSASAPAAPSASAPAAPSASAAPAAPVTGGWRDPAFWARPQITRALATRNHRLADFWLRPQHERARAVPALRGHRALVIDCEDHFTAMLGHQLTALGLDVTIRRFDAGCPVDEYHLVVAGPGPGDPREVDDYKIAAIRRRIRGCLDTGHPLLAVCLSHQVLASLLGLPVRRLPAPNQGAQREIEVFGRREHCGFYNTFAAYAPASRVVAPVPGTAVQLARDPATGVVHAIRGERFRSLQFHAESVLTRRGVDLVGQLITELLDHAPATRMSGAGAERPLLAFR